MPGAGRDAGARHHPARPRRCSRSWRRRRCCPRRSSRTGSGGARPRCSAISMSGRRTRSTRCLRLIGQQVTVRADGTLVKICHRGQVIRTHAQQPAGGRASDPSDFPPDTDIYAAAMRASWRGWPPPGARRSGSTRPGPGYPAAVDKMRAVYALIGLCRTYGSDPVEQACAAALELDVISVAKIKSIVEKGTGKQAAQAAARSRQAGDAAARVTAARFAATPASSPPRPGCACRSCPADRTPTALRIPMIWGLWRHWGCRWGFAAEPAGGVLVGGGTWPMTML